ncbi:MAG: ATP-binding protein [Thermodesulfovibrionales bacterium]|nr:ATP-binding protein [Thermodesulfovibrionales bacterium]
MFASKVEKFIPHAESIFASFKGTDKTNIYDRNDVRDDLLIQFSEAVAFLKKHLNVRSEIRGFDRFDIYEVPLDALREAVVNAIVHRNYAIKGTSIYVRIFDDRVEIENPGGLPDGITRRDFAKSSVRRNPIIADLFHRMGKVERMGSGIDRMRNLMRDAGLREPMFEMDDFFRVTFYRDPRYSLKADRATGEKGLGEKLGEKGGESTEKSKKKGLVDRGVEKGVDRGVEKGVDRLSANETLIYSLIKNNPHISKIEMMSQGSLTKKTVEYNLEKLKKKGILKRIGPDKGGHWEIVKGQISKT